MSESVEIDHESSPLEYQEELDEITQLALAKELDPLAEFLQIPRELLNISLDAVGGGERKSLILVSGQKQRITHFAHMARVAFLVKHFFPTDLHSRILGILHDAKEEAIPGKIERYKDVDVLIGRSISFDIDLLTEEEVNSVDLENLSLPEGFSAEYIAKYRKYIKKLHENWFKVGNLELCDRLDGANFDYLNDPKYKDRVRQKVLESIARVYATISISNDPVAERIKHSCRKSLPQFGVEEAEVVDFSKYFL